MENIRIPLLSAKAAALCLWWAWIWDIEYLEVNLIYTFLVIFLITLIVWVWHYIRRQPDASNCKMELPSFNTSDVQDVLRRYYFEFDRIQHSRIAFWLALQASLFTLAGNSDDGILQYAVGICALCLWFLWYLSSYILNRRLRWIDEALKGNRGAASCPIHVAWLNQRQRSSLSSADMLIFWLPLGILAAWPLFLMVILPACN